MATIIIHTTQNIELEYDLAGVGERLVAGILDLLIIAGYCIIMNIIFSAGLLGHGNAWIMIPLYLPAVFYSLLSETFMNGQSVGKRVMGIKVISINGNQPHFSQYLIRWLFRFIDLWISGFVLAVIVIAATEKHQRLGDIIAGTTLVKTRPRTTIQQTLYMPVAAISYEAVYPEVINLNDSDIQVLKEVIINVQRGGNIMLAWQTKEKIEDVLHIKSRHDEPLNFLYAVLTDYNHLAAKL